VATPVFDMLRAGQGHDETAEPDYEAEQAQPMSALAEGPDAAR